MPRVAFINPNLVFQRDDPFTTGIVYMPVGLAYFAARAREAGYSCQVLDAFGERPNEFREDGRFVIRGIDADELVDRIIGEPLAVCLYAINVTYHRALLRLIRAVRRARPTTPVFVIENTQAVTAYSLRDVQEEFYDAGADFVLCGEAEQRGIELLEALKAGASRETIARIDGIGSRDGDRVLFTEPRRQHADLDALPFPAWDLFPLESYWKLRYAHGPLSAKKYLPLLTSRGCPYPCRFCVIPKTNDVRWRARSAKNVVDEIAHWQSTLGVDEFHVEDVDPTVKETRTRELCQEILDRDLRITWKICAGTKVETIKSEDTVDLMARSGCTYVSISPESGSKRVMQLIKKPFDYDHAVRLVGRMSKRGIRTQACFVLGFPGEEAEDREMTRAMVRDLVRAGVDEIAQFVITPVPGSAIFSELSGYDDYSQLHFSPTWREDYRDLNRFRVRLYRDFLLWKLRFHPAKMLRQPINFLRRRFETKMEMTPYRTIHTMLMLGGISGTRRPFESSVDAARPVPGVRSKGEGQALEARP